MAKQKKPVHRVQMTEGKRNIIHQLLEEYDIETAEDIQDALKDLLGGTIKEMMEASFCTMSIAFFLPFCSIVQLASPVKKHAKLYISCTFSYFPCLRFPF